jgi:hypothetical protein
VQETFGEGVVGGGDGNQKVSDFIRLVPPVFPIADDDPIEGAEGEAAGAGRGTFEGVHWIIHDLRARPAEAAAWPRLIADHRKDAGGEGLSWRSPTPN